MIKNYGFVPSLITEDNYVLGGLVSLPKIILCEDGQWDNFLPLYEPQYNDKYDSYGCTVWGTQNAIEIILERLENKEYNFSERYNYILANIRPPGADPHHIAEIIRKKGMIDNELLPMSFFYEEFLTPNPMTDEFLKIGKKFLSSYEFKHEWIWKSPQTKETRMEKIKECLRYSPLGISVTAWIEKDGIYIDDGQPNTHWTVCYGWNDKGWKVFDSYDQSLKIVSFEHNIQMAKRYLIKKNDFIEIKNTENLIIRFFKFLFNEIMK